MPKLLREIPNQPSQEQLAADPYGCRFVIVFDREYRSLQAKLQRRRAEFGAHTLGDFSQQDEGEALAKWEKRKAELGEAVEQLEHQLQHVKQKRQETAHHLSWDEHPIEDKFERLAPSRKQLMDTVRMIAYRAQKRRWSSLSDRTYNARRMPAAQ